VTDGLKIDLQGLDAVTKRIKELGPKLQKRGAVAAARKGANVIRNQARANARELDDPDTAAIIAKNIVVQNSTRSGKRIGGVFMRIGVLGGARATGKAAQRAAQRRARTGQASLEELGEIAGAGKNNPGGDTWYWRLLEFGTKNMPARSFMRRAANANHQKVVDEIGVELAKQVDKLESL